MTDQEFDNAKFYRGQHLYVNKAYMDNDFNLCRKLVSYKLIGVNLEKRIFLLETEKGLTYVRAKNVEL